MCGTNGKQLQWTAGFFLDAQVVRTNHFLLDLRQIEPEYVIGVWINACSYVGRRKSQRQDKTSIRDPFTPSTALGKTKKNLKDKICNIKKFKRDKIKFQHKG